MSAAAMYFALMAMSGPKAPKQIILTSGSSWTVPADWNSANNKIECIGAGGPSSTGTTQNGLYVGGGGGAYARRNNVSLTPGASVAVSVGASSRSTPTDTWFSTTGTVKAASATAAMWQGAPTSACVGDVTYAGGSAAGGLGGGAAGPNGKGGSAAFGGASGAGDAGFGGAGVTSGDGNPGHEWGTVGSGSGGATELRAGGLYGGGAGNLSDFTAGDRLGAPGIIVITYTPA